MQKKKGKAKEDNKFICTHCGKPKAKSVFYQSQSRIYKAIGILPICKECVGEIFDEYLEQYRDEKVATYRLCEQFNIAFHHNAYQGALTTSGKMGWKVYQAYMSKINSFGYQNGYGDCFADGERLDNDEKSNIKVDPDNLDLSVIEKDIEFTKQDIEAKNDVIKLMGYDPFAGYSLFDQKFLYNELVPYLDEDTLDDTFKLSQIIQLVNNNNQIRKLDLVINSISSDTKALLSNHGEIKSLTTIKNQIVQSTDKIAKENSISVKNRGDKKAGKSTLTYLMKQYRELGFEDAEQDYYDQNKAHGMKITADISNKSILEQLQFDENDYIDMLKTQRQLVEELQSKVEDLEEENRQLYVEIDRYKN